MRMILGLLGACMELAAYYAALVFLEKKGQIVIQRKGRILTDRGIWAAGILNAATAAASGICRIKDLPAVLCLMTMVILWGMSVLSITDARKQVIPNRFLLVLLSVWAVLAGSYLIADFERGTALLALSAAGGLAGGLVFLLCYVISRGQLGAGDVKLAAVLGLYLTGQRIMGAIFYGVLCCSIYSLTMMARKKLGLKDGIPLVPFLYLGMCITLFVV